VIGQQVLERFAGVMAALVGVMQQCIGLSVSPVGHDEGVGHQMATPACDLTFRVLREIEASPEPAKGSEP